MAEPVKAPRRYHSPKRTAKAHQTRTRILAAAHTLFCEQGYVTTTVEQIAGQAGVSTPTVYLAFGTKREILKQLSDTLAAGDDAPVPLMERGWFHQIRDEPDPKRQIQLGVAAAREIYERVAQLLEVVRAAAGADPELATQWETNRAQREQFQACLVEFLDRKDGLREDLTLERAKDIYIALESPELYVLLVHQRGWTPHEWESWVAENLRQQLLQVI
ncbi:MAG: TetR/AcrR family transcriptional regulator [Actinomycetota bacterium]|nr:TetR/AcrR family transcriptional regulator [Actinomycetota bacterium]